MNPYRRFTRAASGSARAILRESEALLSPSTVSIKQSHLSVALHRYRSSSSSSSPSRCRGRPRSWALCNLKSGAFVGQQHPGVAAAAAFRRLSVKSLPSLEPVRFPYSGLGHPFLSFFSTTQRLISTFHHAGMMVWVSDYDFDPKVIQSPEQRSRIPVCSVPCN